MLVMIFLYESKIDENENWQLLQTVETVLRQLGQNVENSGNCILLNFQTFHSKTDLIGEYIVSTNLRCSKFIKFIKFIIFFKYI